MKVLFRKSSLVRVGTPVEDHKVMYLSGADHFVRARHIPLLLFYRALEDGREVLPTEVLVKSLKKLLAKYPPLSGRLKRLPNSSKYELVCNDAGAEFVEASVDGCLAYFGDFQPNRLYTELLDPVPNVIDEITDYPVLYAQVTRFACGGAALVASSVHTVTDGLSFNQFILAWSELARGLELTNPPVHDRTLLKSTIVIASDICPKELRAVTDKSTVAPKMDLNLWPRERMFTFSPAQLKVLKCKAASEGHAGLFTTFESLNAHVWQSITKARLLNSSITTKFLTTLDARKRVKPNLPGGYFGNAICFVSANSTAGEIVKQPLSYTAGLIQHAISGFNEENMRSVVAFVETHDGPFAMNVNAGDDAGHDVSIASWVRMQFPEADFGSGRPVITAPGNNPYDGSVIMLPSHKGEGFINVYVALKSEHMQRLENDPDFILQI